MPPLSIVVPTRDRPELLDACLVALRVAMREDDELVVVDSASTDRRVAEVARSHGAFVVRCEVPGTSRARNAGHAHATHDVIAYVDDDVRVDVQWAAAMSSVFVDPGVAFATGRVAVPPGQEGQRMVAIKDDPNPAVLDRTTPAPIGGSANVAIRSAALAAVGGWDETLGGGARFEAAEDLDLYDRLFAAGMTGRYCPDALAWHDQWRTRRQLLRLDWRYGFGGGARLAKLLRTDRGRARKAAAELVWDDGLVVLGRAFRRHEEFMIAAVALRLLGAAVGLAFASTVRVRAGLFVSATTA
jgi:glycosyltransferase involved in cell wall biosynthesis